MSESLVRPTAAIRIAERGDHDMNSPQGAAITVGFAHDGSGPIAADQGR